MEKLFYPAVFHQEETGFSVNVPDLDGCFSEGNSLEEAYKNTIDAVGLYLSDLEENKQPYPKASDPRSLKKTDDEFIMLVEFDMLAYKKKYDTKAVKKTLTIPSWLNTLAEEKHINFSSVLQDALKNQLDVN